MKITAAPYQHSRQPNRTQKMKLITYWVESIVLLETFFEYSGLVLWEPELLSRGLTVFFIAYTSRTISLNLKLIAVGFSLASFPANARDSTVWRRHASFFFAVRRRRQSVYVDAPKEWPGLCPKTLRVSICMCESMNQRRRTTNGSKINYGFDLVRRDLLYLSTNLLWKFLIF